MVWGPTSVVLYCTFRALAPVIVLLLSLNCTCERFLFCYLQGSYWLGRNFRFELCRVRIGSAGFMRVLWPECDESCRIGKFLAKVFVAICGT